MTEDSQQQSWEEGWPWYDSRLYFCNLRLLFATSFFIQGLISLASTVHISSLQHIYTTPRLFATQEHFSTPCFSILY